MAGREFTRGVGQRLGRGTDFRMLILVFAGWTIIQLVEKLIPPLLPLIIDDLQISSFVAGSALTMMNILYAIGLFPSGQFSDKLSRITPIVLSLIFVAAGTLLLSGATTVVLFFLALSLFGFAKAFYVVPSRALVADLFEAKRGRALGIVTVGSDLGGVLAGTVAIAVLAVATWREPFLPLVALLVITLVLFHVWSREQYVLERTDIEIREPLTRLLGDYRLRRLIGAYSLYWFAGFGVLSFLPTFLEATKPMSLELATYLFILMFATGIVVKPLAGSISDGYSRAMISTVSMLLSGIGLGVVVVTMSVLPITLGVVLFAIGWKMQTPVIEALLMDVSSDQHIGGNLGIVKSLTFAVGSFGPMFIGYTADTVGYNVGFLGLVACLLVGAVMVLSVSDGSMVR